jgi:hypothetical protein
MPDDIGTYIQSVLDWTEKHAGLGGWVGALGSILAIIAAWALARAEYQRTKRLEHARRLSEIDLIARVVNEYDAVIDSYKALPHDGSEAASIYPTHVNDPEWHSMTDLATFPVTSWPTLASYAAFKRYWFASINFLQMAGTTNANKAELYAQWRTTYDQSLLTLKETLRSARSA